MYRSRLSISLALLLTLVALAPALRAQNANQPQSTPAASVMTEDDRIPFMQTEEAEAPREPSSSGLIIKSIGALVLVIGLLFFGTWTLKKLGFGNKSPAGSADEISLSIVSTLALGNGRSISSIRFGDRVLLVGTTPQSFTLLAEETPLGNDFAENPRSVAEMLDDEELSFDEEFDIAKGRMGMWERDGGGA